MSIIINHGTLLFTPEGGQQTSVSSNEAATELNVSYELEVSYGASPDTFVPGATILYTAVIRNTGTGTLQNPVVTADMGGGALVCVDDSAAAFLACDSGISQVPVAVVSGCATTFSLSCDLPAGGVIVLTYNATVAATDESSITACIEVSAGEPQVEKNCTATAETTITRSALSLVKSAPGCAEIGENVAYTFTVTNYGAEAVTLDQLTDQLPANFVCDSVGLTIGGVEQTLTQGTDYTVSAANLFTLNPAGTLTVPASGCAVLTLGGSFTA